MTLAREESNEAELPTDAPSAKAGVGLLVALAVIALLLWAFAALADGFNEKGRIAQLDLAVLDWLQQHGTESGEGVFVFVSWLGAPVLVAVDVVVAAWLALRRRWRWLALWAVAIVGGLLLDEMLKLAFHRARPSVASEFITKSSWSFPSGHAMNSLVGYAMLAFLLREHLTNTRARLVVTIGAVILIAAIGFSRLYLGVHYLSDVTAGYLAGSAWVLACVTAERYAIGRSHSRTSGSRS
ncbi:MAG TPA: phosphatase PAP2 family protein [Gemmatimonadaceae bacterium]